MLEIKEENMEDEGLTQTLATQGTKKVKITFHKVAGLKTIVVHALNIKFTYIHEHILSPETTWSGPRLPWTENNSGLMLGLLLNQSTLIFTPKNNTTMIIYNKKGGAGRDQGER